MKKQFLFLTLVFGALSVFAQTPYDNFAPEQNVKSMIELPQVQFQVANTDTNSEIRYVEFDKNTLSLNLLDDNGNVIMTFVLNPKEKKFTTMDPLAEKYPSISPYAYCGNNPINAVDLRGDSITYVINSTITNPDGTTSISSSTYYYGQDANGNYGFIGSNGQIYSGSDTYLNSLTTAVNSLRTGGNTGNALVSDLMNSTNTVQVVRGSNAADPNGTYIRWNPNSSTGGMNVMGNENRPSYIGLGHEMAHIQDTWKGTIDNSTWVTTAGGVAIPNSEKYATHIENQLRAENGVALRTHYGIDASTGVRVGLESTRIVSGGTSLFYNQSNGVAPNGIRLLSTPFVYRR